MSDRTRNGSSFARVAMIRLDSSHRTFAWPQMIHDTREFIRAGLRIPAQSFTEAPLRDLRDP